MPKRVISSADWAALASARWWIRSRTKYETAKPRTTTEMRLSTLNRASRPSRRGWLAARANRVLSWGTIPAVIGPGERDLTGDTAPGQRLNSERTVGIRPRPSPRGRFERRPRRLVLEPPRATFERTSFSPMLAAYPAGGPVKQPPRDRRGRARAAARPAAPRWSRRPCAGCRRRPTG